MSLLSGEWWLDGCRAIFADGDGDVGDTNHEIAAFYAFIGIDEETLNDFNFYNGHHPDEEKTAAVFLGKYENKLRNLEPFSNYAYSQGISWPDAFRDKQVLSALTKIAKTSNWITGGKNKISAKTVISALCWQHLSDLGLNIHFVNNGGLDDPRKYALVHGGWIRVKNDNFEFYELNEKTLSNIRNSDVWEQAADPESLEISEETVGLNEVKTGAYFEVPVSLLLASNTTIADLKKADRYRRSGSPGFALNPRRR
jgi:hypothetical protein